MSELQKFFEKINTLEIDHLSRIAISSAATELALQQWKNGYTEASVDYQKMINKTLD